MQYASLAAVRAQHTIHHVLLVGETGVGDGQQHKSVPVDIAWGKGQAYRTGTDNVFDNFVAFP
jgi:hypothetical protein